MAKPKPELAQRCPPPPYTRWDQRGKPVLLSYLKLIDRRRPVSALFSAWLLRPPSAGLCSGPGSLNRFSASLSGVLPGVRLPCGWAAG